MIAFWNFVVSDTQGNFDVYLKENILHFPKFLLGILENVSSEFPLIFRTNRYQEFFKAMDSEIIFFGFIFMKLVISHALRLSAE